MQKNEETITMILPTEEGRFVEGAINGVTFRIPTGVQVEVPLRISRLLEQCQQERRRSQAGLQAFTAAGGRRL